MIEALAARLGSSASALSAAGVLIAFAGGVIAGFGPCVYPMIPVLIAYLTGQAGELEREDVSRWRALALSATFVLGLAVMFAAIGAAAGAVGSAIRFSRAWFYAVGALSIVVGLALLGLVPVNLGVLSRRLPGRPRWSGFLGAFSLGVVYGVVATPCSTPILAAITAMAAVQGSAVRGALLLFVYGLGKGAPLLLVGAFAGLALRLRSLTAYTHAVQKFGGAVFVAFGCYLLWIA